MAKAMAYLARASRYVPNSSVSAEIALPLTCSLDASSALTDHFARPHTKGVTSRKSLAQTDGGCSPPRTTALDGSGTLRAASS